MANVYLFKNGQFEPIKTLSFDLVTCDLGILDEFNFDYLTIHAFSHANAHRIRGLYVYGTASGELEYQKNINSYVLTASSKKLSDVVELTRLVRAGLITPVNSYEAPQIISMPREIRDLFREIWKLVKIGFRRWISGMRFRLTSSSSTLKA